MLYIVLPAYNEELTLPPLLNSIRENLTEAGLDYHVLVVDDGSTDKTIEAAQDKSAGMPIEIIRHTENRGLAETLRTGLLEAVKKSTDRDIIITMDADNTHTPGLIIKMSRMIREGHDIVIGSRYSPGARVIGVPLHRQALSFGARLLFGLLFPIRGVRDYTSGFRAYRAGLIKEMFEHYGGDFINEPGFSAMVDVLLKIRKYPVIIGEAPLILRYDLKEGQSKMKVLKTITDTLKLICRRRFLK